MLDLQQLSSLFWNTKFWLSSDLRWTDVQPKDEYDYTDYRHLYLYPVPLAVIMLVFRLGLDKYCFFRLGLSLGMKTVKSKRAPTNPILEKAYKANSKWTHKDVVSLSKQTDCTERKIERWLRLRKMQDKPTTIYKFSESCWRCFYYSNIFIYGLSNLWTMPWLRDLSHCWMNYPHQEFSPEIWWYCMISLGFYISIIITQVFDNRRRDLWPTTVQHILIISLLMISWISNLYRIAVVVLLLHDITDALVQGGKALRYAKNVTIGTYVIYIFFVTWSITRLILFPFWILHNTLFKVPAVLSFPAYYCFNCILVLLFCVHMYKSYLMVNVFSKYFSVDKFDGGNGGNSSKEQNR